jgi:23S rRNA pseudouridine2605 synthase
MKLRLNRYLSLCGLASRRKAEILVESGEIIVNGVVEKRLQRIIDSSKDEVFYKNNKLIVQDFEYYKMNKPRFFLTTMAIEEKRKTVLDLLPKVKTKLFPIGRLDYDTEGLLLFTNDGQMAHRISHPSFLIQKTYLAHLKGNISKTFFEKMKKGANLSDGFLLPEKLDLLSSNAVESLIKMEIHEGRNHIVKNFFKYFGRDVAKLKRISVGPIKLGELESGKIIKLDYNELEELKSIVFK